MQSNNRLLEVVARSIYYKLLSHRLGLLYGTSNDTFCSLIPERLSPCPFDPKFMDLSMAMKEKKKEHSLL